MSTPGSQNRVTLRTLRQMVREHKTIPFLTCYDATSARWLWRGGVRCLLVGDTAAQMILGHDSTLPVSLRFMIDLTAAVRRGAPDAFLMADMPFGSYQSGEDRAMRNAMAFLKRGCADVVKLEVEAAHAPLVARLTAAGVPVVAHIGSRPQMVRAQGGYRAAGRTAAEANKLVQTARLMAESGAAMLLVEAVPAETAAQIVETVANAQPPVPVIGCGAGPACHGHVIVLHDLLGLTDWQPPFAKPVTNFGAQLAAAASTWVQLVESGAYAKREHPYKMS